jgi:hypothetical protein
MKKNQPIYAEIGGRKYEAYFARSDGETAEVYLRGSNDLKRVPLACVEEAIPTPVYHNARLLAPIDGWAFTAYQTFADTLGHPWLVAVCQKSGVAIRIHYAPFSKFNFSVQGNDTDIALIKIEELKPYAGLFKVCMFGSYHIDPEGCYKKERYLKIAVDHSHDEHTHLTVIYGYKTLSTGHTRQFDGSVVIETVALEEFVKRLAPVALYGLDKLDPMPNWVKDFEGLL